MRREGEKDRHGIADTMKARYLVHWRRYRKSVKAYQRVVNAVRAMWGMSPTWIQLPEGWGDDAAWSHAELDPHMEGAKPKASKGMRESASAALGLRKMFDHEAHGFVSEVMDMHGGDPDPFDEDVRRDLREAYMKLTLEERRVMMRDDVNLLTCADLMAHPVPIAPDVDPMTPFAKYPYAGVNWELMDDGTMRCWTRWGGWGPMLTFRGGAVKHVAFAKHHGWEVRGHDERTPEERRRDDRYVKAIEEALVNVSQGRVKVYEPKRGKPPLVWVVYDWLGRHGITSCVSYAGKFRRNEELEVMLDEVVASA